MNSLTIIGNLVANPECRLVNRDRGTISVCNFTVAVNRMANGQRIADYFRVATWGKLAEICMNNLQKGRKVAVVGTVTASAYTGNDGAAHANLEVTAEKVEFVSSRQDDGMRQQAAPPPEPYNDYPADDDHLPF